PFKPFALALASGRLVRVMHPELVIIPPKPNDWEIAVYEKGFDIIDLAHVEAVNEIQSSRSNGKGHGK
ncbi:MAG TPA: hypothetical protein VK530_15315, partial [Candidatus Acidoferrum sp.]|nr:hypothetical protein [Candidatus Acidoferrum sp.]